MKVTTYKGELSSELEHGLSNLPHMVSVRRHALEERYFKRVVVDSVKIECN